MICPLVGGDVGVDFNEGCIDWGAVVGYVGDGELNEGDKARVNVLDVGKSKGEAIG